MHFHSYPTFSRQAKKFDSGLREARTIRKKLIVAAPILLVIGLSMGIRTAVASDDATTLVRLMIVVITTLVIEVVGLGAVLFATVIGQLNDRIKPPLPDGTRRRSLLIYVLLVPFLCLVSLIGFCFLFVVFMQPHPLHFMMTMFQ